MQTATLNVEIPEYYKGYVNNLKGLDFLEVLSSQMVSTAAFLRSISGDKWNYAYAEGKWTIKELICHLIDTERIFTYRALRFSRNDQTPLAGFEENDYVPNSGVNDRAAESLIREYESVRSSTLELYKNLSDDMLQRTGTANGKKFSVLLIGIITAGHELHHLGILKERYLK